MIHRTVRARAAVGVFALALAVSAMACASAAGDGGADADVADANPTQPDANATQSDANEQGGIDAGNNCTKQPCDLIPQCGCASPEVCGLDGNNLATGGTICRDSNPAGTDTATCSGPTDCAGGYVCLGNPGQCRAWCQADIDCGGNGALCLLQVTYGSGMDVPGAITCTKACGPTNGSGCPTAFACHIFLDDPDMIPGNSDDRYLTDCTSAPAVGGGDGASCVNNSDCASGFDCITLNSVPQCKQSCVCPAQGNCGGGTCGTGTCTGFADPRPIIAGTEFGVCI